MSDENKVSELALSTFYGTPTTTVSDNGDDQTYSPKIDPSLLLDANKLRIGPQINGGSYSIVYQGLYESMPVAIKVLHAESSQTSTGLELYEKFSREVSMISRAQHDNILKFIGALEKPNKMIITELMNGGTLQKFLCDLRPNCPDLKLSLSYALDISRAMQYLHQNRIIHRDLKPSNILLTEDKKRIKVADFGLAREESVEDMTTQAGTYRWMAPEMFNNIEEASYKGQKKHYDHKVDVYSFSLVLWELLTNNTPFSDRTNILAAYAATQLNLRPSVDEIPEKIAPLVQSCWDAKPEVRPEFYQITKFLQNYLDSICQAENSSPETPPSPSKKQYSMRKEDNEDVPATNRLMDRSKGSAKKPNSSCSRFLCCT